MRTLIVFLAFCTSAFAQVTSIPAAAGGSPGGATAVSGLSDLKVTRNSDTVLAVAGGSARRGATTTAYSAATATLSGTVATSTAYVYVTAGGTLTVGHNGAATVTCSGCTTATGISAFPADAIPLATATYTSTAWDVSGITDLRAIPSRENLAAGDGISLGFTASGVTASTDSATVPRYSTGSGVPAAACTQGRDFYLDTAAAQLYQCTATNTWAAVGGLDSAPYMRVLYAGNTADVCSGSVVTIYEVPANALDADDIVEIEAQHFKSGTTATPSVSIFIEATNASGANAMGSTATEAYAQNRVIARIASTTSTRTLGLRQRSNSSVGGTYNSSITVDTTSSTGFTIGAQATSCGAPAETVSAQVIVKVYKNGAR